jgi:hypothetical protein
MGLHVAACWPGMIIYELRQVIAAKLYPAGVKNLSPLTQAMWQWIKKPLCECPVCMASFWSLIYWITLIRTNYAQLILVIPAVAGINLLLCIVLQKYTDYGCNG